MALTATHVDQEDALRGCGLESVDDAVLNIEPIHPVGGGLLLHCHPLLEILGQVWVMTEPLEVAEVGIET